MMYENIEKYIAEKMLDIKTGRIETSDIKFESKNELLCFYCEKYNNKWTCPPKIPKCDYKKMFEEYNNGILIYRIEEINGKYDEARENSTVKLHRAILKIEEYLFSKGHITRLSFIGGSCKLCKNGCSPDKCRNPYEARIPLEAAGVNVIETAAKAGIDIKFPVEDTITRIGLILW